MIKGAIFDLDGTLLDSMSVWDTIGENYLCSLGYTPHENLNETFKSMSLYQACCYYKSEYGVQLSVEELMAGVNKMVEDFYFHKVQAKEGVADFLQELNRRGVKMCVATATDRYQVIAALKRLGIYDYFSDFFTCTEMGSGKDEPMIYREALRHLGTEKSSTVVFEDAAYALETAKQDGFVTVGVFDYYSKDCEKIKSLSDFYLHNFGQTDEFWMFADKL